MFQMLWSVFAYDPLRVKVALKGSVACVIALWIVLTFQFSQAYWPLITILVISLPNMGATLQKGLMRFAGTVVGAVFGLILFGTAAQSPWLFLPMIFLWIALITYLGDISSHPYAYMLCGITTVLVGLGGIESPHAVQSLAFERCTEITTGIVVALVVHALFWPVRASRELPASLASTLDDCRELLLLVHAEYTHPGTAPRKPPELHHKISQSFARHSCLLDNAAAEGAMAPALRARACRLILYIENLFISISGFEHLLLEEKPREVHAFLSSEWNAVVDEIQCALKSLADSIREHRPTPTPSHALRNDLSILMERYGELRKSGTLNACSLEDIASFNSFVEGLSHVSECLIQAIPLADALLEIENPENTPHSAPTREVVWDPREWIRGFRLRPIPLRHGIKTGLAVVTSTWIWMYFIWPGGLTSVISAVIVINTSVGATRQKSFLRLVGALAGGAISLIVVLTLIPHISTFTPFATIVFIVSFLSLYIYSGSARYAYAGFQMGMTFYMATLFEPTQSIALEPVRYRILGVLMGVVVSVLITRYLWPLHATIEFRRNLAGLLDLGTRLFRTIIHPNTPVSQCQSAINTTRVEIRKELDLCLNLLTEAQSEPGYAGEPARLGAEILEIEDALLHKLAFAGNLHRENLDRPFYREIALSSTILHAEILAILTALGPSLRNAAPMPSFELANTALLKLEDQLAEMRRTRSGWQVPAEETMPVVAMIERHADLMRVLHLFANRLHRLNQISPPERDAFASAWGLTPPRPMVNDSPA